MTKLKPYKGYSAELEIDFETGLLSGGVIGLRDMIMFEALTVPEAVQAFQDAVDDYLEWCKELGRAPEKQYAGKIIVRMDPLLHRRLARHAEQTSTSVNSFVIEAVEHYLDLPKEQEFAAVSSG